MPRSLQDIIDHADELADRFERAEAGVLSDGTPLRNLAALIEQRGRTEAEIGRAVASARAAGVPWSALGTIIGTSGEAVRQRYAAAFGTTGGSTKTAPVERSGRAGRLIRSSTGKVVRQMTTGKKDASAASKQLRSKSSSKAQKSVAASDLAQARKSGSKKK
jgi:hypothetical protein